MWRRGRIKGSTLNHANVNGRLMTCFVVVFLAPTKTRPSRFSLARLIALLPVSTDEQEHGLHLHAFLAMQIVKRLCVCLCLHVGTQRESFFMRDPVFVEAMNHARRNKCSRGRSDRRVRHKHTFMHFNSVSNGPPVEAVL